MDLKKMTAEFLGTAILVLFGVGSAVFGRDQIGAVGIALAFGFTLLALAYAFGPVSGAHVNPAVTLGMLVTRRISVADALGYWIAQLVGGIVGAAGIRGLVSLGGVQDQTGALGSNNYGSNINLGGAFLLETVLTFLLVLVVLIVTGRTENAGFAGLTIGITLTVLHLVGIPLTGTSVNPARSLGPALFDGGGASLAHLWVFILAPLAGGVLAALVHPLVADTGSHYHARPADQRPQPVAAQASSGAHPAQPAATAPLAGNSRRRR